MVTAIKLIEALSKIDVLFWILFFVTSILIIVLYSDVIKRYLPHILSVAVRKKRWSDIIKPEEKVISLKCCKTCIVIIPSKYGLRCGRVVYDVEQFVYVKSKDELLAPLLEIFDYLSELRVHVTFNLVDTDFANEEFIDAFETAILKESKMNRLNIRIIVAKSYNSDALSSMINKINQQTDSKFSTIQIKVNEWNGYETLKGETNEKKTAST